MRTAVRRITALLSLSVTALVVMATPAPAAAVATNDWTCDLVSQFNAPPVNPAIGTGNCTGGNPQVRGGRIFSRLLSDRVSCGIIDTSNAPQRVVGSYCSPP